ncbi:MAG: alpha/beta hydrolase [Verrucomicrobiae bacterium]|nr:alpha/beta hydrolase [Verrucomicrobiae bacterium]
MRSFLRDGGKVLSVSACRVVSIGLAVSCAINAHDPARVAAAPVAEGAEPARDGRRKVIGIEKDVEYGRGGDRALTLNVFTPLEKSTKPRPGLVWFHGGGWQSGSHRSGGPVQAYVATGDFVGFSVGYRLSGEAKWPAQIEDSKAAIRFIRANADRFNVDPDRIGVWGSSAGGHLAALLGVSGAVERLDGKGGTPGVSSRVACVVDFCGPANFLRWYPTRPGVDHPAAVALFGGPTKDNERAAVDASPITHVAAGAPPFLIVHGTDDTTVPIQHSEQLAAALERVGADVTFVRVEGGAHMFHGAEVDARVAAFLAKHLLGKKTTVSDAPIRVAPEPGRKQADNG